ncbi:MAG: hypothetical protein VX528_01435 [Candidatus Latescibacterota bacterium]|nr:hypothetical protein [Candidatus Latescibacterota bacterium]
MQEIGATIGQELQVAQYKREVEAMITSWKRLHGDLPSAASQTHLIEFASDTFDLIHELAGFDPDRRPQAVAALRKAITGECDIDAAVRDCVDLMFQPKSGSSGRRRR